MNNDTVLSLNKLSKRFGTVVANESVSIDLKRGEILSLLGENGAGKTTLMNMLFGHYMPDAGTIQVANTRGQLEPLTLGHPQAALDAGIGMVHQHFTLAENLSAIDNILLGSENLFAWRRSMGAAREKINSIMHRTGLNAPLDTIVGQLSVGERQRVEILKALYRDARILVLDEPTAVLTPQEADTLFANIDVMTKDGLSVIFISHKLREVLAFSHRIAVLRHGKKVGEIATKDADEKIISRLMVGADTPVTPKEALDVGAPVLQLIDLCAPGTSARSSLEHINLTVSASEIVGIAGISGNGQSTLAQVISGLTAPTSGRLEIDSDPVLKYTPASLLKAGVGRIPEDRHHDGVIGAMSVAENLAIERLDSSDIQKNGFLRQQKLKLNAQHLSEKYDIRGPGIEAEARLLSGGNIQKLILARVFEASPKLILANQPTRGLDMGAVSEVGKRLLQARKRGAGILLISEDLDELLALADRIIIMHDGELHAAPSHDRAQIGLIMAGEIS
jgi:ABC-type uncharacterized transport system ATPase subunit